MLLYNLLWLIWFWGIFFPPSIWLYYISWQITIVRTVDLDDLEVACLQLTTYSMAFCCRPKKCVLTTHQRKPGQTFTCFSAFEICCFITWCYKTGPWIFIDNLYRIRLAFFLCSKQQRFMEVQICHLLKLCCEIEVWWSETRNPLYRRVLLSRNQTSVSGNLFLFSNVQNYFSTLCFPSLRVGFTYFVLLIPIVGSHEMGFRTDRFSVLSTHRILSHWGHFSEATS